MLQYSDNQTNFYSPWWCRASNIVYLHQQGRDVRFRCMRRRTGFCNGRGQDVVAAFRALVCGRSNSVIGGMGRTSDKKSIGVVVLDACMKEALLELHVQHSSLQRCIVHAASRSPSFFSILLITPPSCETSDADSRPSGNARIL